MHLEVRHLRMIAAITDAGGVTGGAERVGLSQSALSHQLAEIESRLGTRLFTRTGRRMVLTPGGERLLDAARGILAELEQVESEIVALGTAGPVGRLRLATECYTCYHWLPPVMTTFRERWARVEIDLVPEATRRPLDALKADELDLAILSELPTGPRRALPRRFTSVPLFNDELVAIMAPSHPLARKPFVEPEDFGREQLFLYNLRPEESTLLRDVLRPAGVRPRRVSRVELSEAIIELVKAGMGVAALARWAVEPHVRAGTLASVRITPGGIHRRWMAVHAADSPNAHFAAEFARCIAARATPRPIERPEPRMITAGAHAVSARSRAASTWAT